MSQPMHPCVRAAVFLSSLVAPAGAQSTWYVDASAPPPGLGTLMSPYAQIQYALDQPSTLTDDVVSVAPGLYVENVVDRRRVRLRASGGPLVTKLRPAISTAPAFEVSFFSAIEGFTVTGYTGLSAVQGALVLYGGTARRCILRGNSGTAVYADSAMLEHCTVVDNGKGVFVEFFSGVILRNSIVWSNDIDFPQVTPFGIEAYYSAGALPPQAFGSNNVVGDPFVWELDQQRHFLLPGSPCIDAGDPAAPTDPDGSRADIGAVPFDASYAPMPSAYCTARTNSLGCVPAISAVGAASASGAPFTIQCANQRSHSPGLLFYGFAPLATPYQGGYLCVQAPTQRTPVSDSGGAPGALDCSGAYSFDFGARIQSGTDPALVAGQLVFTQFWSRDPGVSFSTLRSDALSFGIAQ